MKNYIRKAAEHFLIQPLPDNWDKLNGGEQEQFIKENIWQPFEGMDVNAVWEQVEDLAHSFQEVDKAAVDRVLTDMIKKINPQPTY